MWICGRPPASRDKMKTNPWRRKGNKNRGKGVEDRELSANDRATLHQCSD